MGNAGAAFGESSILGAIFFGEGMSMKVRPTLGLHLANFAAETHRGGWEHLFALARAADVAGIDRVMVSDHVVMGEALDDYARPEIGGRAGGQQPTGPDGLWLDPLVTLSMVAAQTRRVRLSTQILLAALRRPVTLAKSVATLDVLSGGRLDLGVGVGWQQAEYDAAGLPFATRGKLLDHTLEVCMALWSAGGASIASPYLNFEKIHQAPKPLQPNGVPFWISGTVRETTARRLVRFGQRWIAWGKDENMAESLPRMRDAIAEAGGAPETLLASGPLPMKLSPDRSLDIPATMERMIGRLEAGQTDFTFFFTDQGDENAKTEKLSKIVEAFDAATGR